jgi:peptidoglycan/LPS O-acetylase OafA/YrhL
VVAPQGPGGSRADTPEKKPRLLQLDVLRGLAVLLVLNFHQLDEASKAGKLRPLAKAWHQFGWTGVDLFFVLSGFLVGGLLFAELRAQGTFDARRFIIRRGFKIWPSYLVYVAFLFVVLGLTGEGFAASFRTLLPNLFHVQNYWAGPRGHTWSLAVEEHFYLALPLVLYLLVRGRKGGSWIRLFPWIALGTLVTCLALRYARPVHVDATGEVFMRQTRWTHYYPTHMRIDSLFFGVLLAYFFHFHPARLAAVARYRRTLLLAGAALLLPMVYRGLMRTAWVSVAGYTLAYLGYGCILLAVVYTPAGQGWLGRTLASRAGRVLAFIGVYSYPIYLWHVDAGQQPMLSLIQTGALEGLPAEVRWCVLMVLYVLLAVAAGVVMAKLVERPALALRDRLFPSHVPVLLSPAAAAAGNAQRFS